MIALALVSLFGSPALAQDMPREVRVLVPACSGSVDWPALESALRVELRSLGSDIASAPGAMARLSIDADCARLDAIDAELTRADTGRSAARRIALGDRGGEDLARSLALALSEMVRALWPTLSAEERPPTIAPAPRELGGAMLDVALAVTAFPGSPNATGDLRVALSLGLTELLRVAIELDGGAGWVNADLGDVFLFALGGAISLRLAHVSHDLVLELGPRLDLGYAHAEGVAAVPGVRGQGLDAFDLAPGLDARARVRLAGAAWLVLGAEIGAGLAGLDARAGATRIASHLGLRVALVLGLAFALE